MLRLNDINKHSCWNGSSSGLSLPKVTKPAHYTSYDNTGNSLTNIGDYLITKVLRMVGIQVFSHWSWFCLIIVAFLVLLPFPKPVFIGVYEMNTVCFCILPLDGVSIECNL